MKNIYSYRDYRSLLKDYYIKMKRSQPGFTYQSFSQAAGIKSPNYLKLVSQGERNLTDENLIGFATAMQLDELEQDFFEVLVRYNQASTKVVRLHYKKRMDRLSGEQKKRTSEEKGGSIKFGMFVPAAAVCLADNQPEDAISILQEKLVLSEVDAKELYREVKMTNLLELDGNGSYIINADHTFFRDRSKSKNTYMSYVQNHLRYCERNLSNLYKQGKFVCLSFTTNPKSMDRLHALVSEFIATFNDRCDDSGKREVYQLSVQLYPFSDRR